MKSSFWIALAASVAVCIVAVTTQAARNRSLAKQLAERQGEVEPRSAGTSAAASPTSSAARIDRVLTEVAALAPDASEAAAAGDPFQVANFPELLRAVEGLDLDELIAVAEAMPESENRTRLLLLAAEQDPLRVYHNGELMAGTSEQEVLEALARKDPAAALGELPPLDAAPADSDGVSEGTVAGIFKLTSGAGAAPLLGNWALEARIRYATKLLGTDLEAGLAALLEVHELDPGGDGRIPIGVVGSMGAPSLPRGSISGLVDAMSRPEYAGIRDDLIGMVVMNTQFDEGVAAAGQQLQSMPLTPVERDRAIDDMIRWGALEAQPVAMVDWLAQASPDQVPSAVVRWANRDQQGAVEWLGQLEPSPLRDEAIASFAKEASELDRKTAAAWANEIGDETLRKETLRQVEER